MNRQIATGLAVAAAGLGALSAAAQPRGPAPPPAQQSLQRTTLQEQPFPGPVLHTVMTEAVVARGGEVAAHTHPGIEMAYIASGRALVRITGRPDQDVAAGGSFSVPDHVVHSVRNIGPGPLTMISTYVVDRRKPLASPALGAR